MRSSFLFVLSVLIMLSCGRQEQGSTSQQPPVHRVGAMKDVMWKGELGAKVQFDTLSPKAGLYGLGPLSYLAGEILINDGRAFVSRVVSESSMSVEESYDISAPFFVYANVLEWKEIQLAPLVSDIKSLEEYLAKKTPLESPPFAFKLKGRVSSATIHIQNLPEGSVVSSPQEAHQGQQNYQLENEAVEIIGFFSRNDQGVFTHHDSFLHMHLITQDEDEMGHLDHAVFEEMTLYLPSQQ